MAKTVSRLSFLSPNIGRIGLMLGLSALMLTSAPVAHAGGGGGEKKAEDAFVKLAPMALPVVQNGRVVNYVFVSIKVMLAPTADSTKLREKEPYFRDALVRAGHRTPFSIPGDDYKLDETKIKAVLTAEGNRIAGAKVVSGVQIESQTPKKARR
ncbi:MAG: hypothetical protein ACK41P_01590 [Asticcacaulis sp.]